MAIAIKQIFCIDHDEDALNIIRLALKSTSDCEVQTFSNINNAVETALHTRPDLILLNAAIPHMNGLSALKFLREQKITSPVILMATSVDPEQANQYLQAGSAGIITKPFDPITLYEEIQALLEKSSKKAPLPAVNVDNLLERYLVDLTQQQEKLRRYLYLCQRDQLNSSQIEDLQSLIHTLLGSSGIFNFTMISQAASELDNALQNMVTINASQLGELLNTMLTACSTTLNQHRLDTINTVNEPENSLAPILLIDDDPATLEQLQTILKQNAVILTANNRDQALSHIHQQHPALLLLNPKLPQIQALRLIETIQAIPNYHDIEIILLVEESSINEVADLIMAGAEDYITKPIKPSDITGKLLQKLQKKHTLVLIVDDDETIVNLLAHKFRASGCQVAMAEDGHEALKKVEETLPNLVILDLMMPGLDGISVLQTLRNNPKFATLPVIILTVKHSEEDIVAGFKLGASDYITKPFLLEELMVRSFRLLNLSGRKH